MLLRRCWALSIVAPHGANIASGLKRLEVRSWKPRALPLKDLVIVENGMYLSEARTQDPDGRAVALVDVLEVHPWQPSEVDAACSSGWQAGYYAWVLSNVRALRGDVRVPAMRKLYEVVLPCDGFSEAPG
jgi:hypothetical protein